MTTLSNINATLKFAADLVSDLLGANFVRNLSLSIPFGNGAGQVNAVVARSIAVPTGTPLDIDVRATNDVAGAALLMTAYLGYLLINNSATPGENYSVGGGTNPLFAADPVVIEPGSFAYRFNLQTGIATSGTVKTFRASSAAGTPAGVLLLFGRQ